MDGVWGSVLYVCLCVFMSKFGQDFERGGNERSCVMCRKRQRWEHLKKWRFRCSRMHCMGGICVS